MWGEILRPIVRPYAGAVGPGFLLVQWALGSSWCSGQWLRPYAGAEGPGFLLLRWTLGSSWCRASARPHVVRVWRWFLDDEGIEAIDWPSHSPDLNPTENLWDIMYLYIRHLHVAPQTVQGLTDALIQVWEEMPQIRRLIRSMSRCCEVCPQARGGHAHY